MALTKLMSPPRFATGLASGVGAARDLLALTKPRITLAVAAAAAVGAAMPAGPRDLRRSVACVLGVALVSGAACALNMWIERESDARMDRTRSRPLPGGRLPAATALILAGALTVAGVATLLLRVSPDVAILSLLSLALYAFAYTPLKRHTPFAFVVGLLPGALPALLGAMAATGGVERCGLALFVLLCLWQVPHTLALHAWQGDAYRVAGLCALDAGRHGASLRRLSIAWAAGLALVGGLAGGVAAGGLGVAVILALPGVWLAVAGTRGWATAAGAEGARRFFRLTLGYLAVTLAILAVARVSGLMRDAHPLYVGTP